MIIILSRSYCLTRYAGRTGEECILQIVRDRHIFKGESLQRHQLGDNSASWVMGVNCKAVHHWSDFTVLICFWGRVCDWLRYLTCREGNRESTLQSTRQTWYLLPTRKPSHNKSESEVRRYFTQRIYGTIAAIDRMKRRCNDQFYSRFEVYKLQYIQHPYPPKREGLLQNRK